MGCNNCKGLVECEAELQEDMERAGGEHVLEKGEACPVVEMQPTMAHVACTILNDHASL